MACFFLKQPSFQNPVAAPNRSVVSTSCATGKSKRCRLIFHDLQMDYDETSARKLLDELDEDKSGLIDFQEFCAFIARIKCVGSCRWPAVCFTFVSGFTALKAKGPAVHAGFAGILKKSKYR